MGGACRTYVRSENVLVGRGKWDKTVGGGALGQARMLKWAVRVMIGFSWVTRNGQ